MRAPSPSHPNLVRLQDDDMYHPNVGLCFTDTCVIILHKIISMSVFVVAQASIFVVAKIDQIKLPKKVSDHPSHLSFMSLSKSRILWNCWRSSPRLAKKAVRYGRHALNCPCMRVSFYIFKLHASILETNLSLVDVHTGLHSEIKRKVCEFWDCFDPDGLLLPIRG
jgi:hypothetical protein